MRHNTIVITLILLLTGISLFYFFFSKPIKDQPLSDGITFTGTITEINTDCWSDGTCSIKVGSYWVIAEIGGLMPPGTQLPVRGRLQGLSFGQEVDQYIGKTASVYASNTDEANVLTLYGDEDYYIKILE